MNAYYRHLDNVVILCDNINTERAEGIYAVAQNMKTLILPIETIVAATDLHVEEIENL